MPSLCLRWESIKLACKSPISFREFLQSCSDEFGDVSFRFENVGTVRPTTITRANLELLRRSREAGYAGIFISCPDFERESIAIACLAALLHLEHDPGNPGLHEPQAGERVAIGSCVANVTKSDDKEVMFQVADGNTGFLKSSFNPLAHTARPDCDLSKTRSTAKRKHLSIKDAAAQYENIPAPSRHILDLCGKSVESVGYCSSPSQYINEPPTHIPSGLINVREETSRLSGLLPITHFQANGKACNDFEWPFAARPSIYVCPRVDGIGTSRPIADAVQEGASFDFVSFNLSCPDSLDTSLYTDFLDLKDAGVGVIGLCDQWTLSRVAGDLEKDNFLCFDWNSCALAEQSNTLALSPIQSTVMARPQQILIPVPDDDCNLWRAAQILYGHFAETEFNTDEAAGAIARLFSVLGTALRMTETPDANYAQEQQSDIRNSMKSIRESRSLTPEDYAELVEARDILNAIFQPGHRLPKEEKIYERISSGVEAGKHVVLVVDKNRTEPVQKYWLGKIAHIASATNLFRVVNTREYMTTGRPSKNEVVIFSGWYDRGTMDRALHSGISATTFLVLYGHDNNAGLEIDWWNKAQAQWKRSSSLCAGATNRALHALGIEEVQDAAARSPKLSRVHADNIYPGEKDMSPAHIVTAIERNRLQKDLAKDGEKSVRATPVMFNDGSHIWLKTTGKKSAGGRIIVITDCLYGGSGEPTQKTAASLLPGDIVLRTHSDREYIKKASEKTTSGYDSLYAQSQKWREPIHSARRSGLTDAEITDRIFRATKRSRTEQAVRAWVKGYRIAPQTIEDIKAVYTGLRYPVTEEEFRDVISAVRAIRNKHRAVGRMAKKDMVAQFLNDVRNYGVDDAVSGFDERHEAGDIELLRVTSIGNEMNVAPSRALIM